MNGPDRGHRASQNVDSAFELEISICMSDMGRISGNLGAILKYFECPHPSHGKPHMAKIQWKLGYSLV